MDTNNSPDGIDYLIPGNDDLPAIKLYLKLFAEVREEARRRHQMMQMKQLQWMLSML